MRPKGPERRLTTILSADVAGYSRLMGQDEEGTLAALKAYREQLIEPKAAQYNGRTIKLMGDGALMEFPSVVDAMTFAVEVQMAMVRRNSDIPETPRIAYRIGINIGDVIVEAGDIYGDGVNLAARLQSLAEPGGICISRAVRDQIRDKLDLTMVDLGEVELKNMTRRVRAWRWLPAGYTSRAAAQDPAKHMISTSKPSIAVLPFVNMSRDPDQEYFSDGISEDIITLLSRNRWLYVIARNSSFAYRDKETDVRQIGRELGARYVVEGSIRRFENRVRATANLIDTRDGTHLWSERYDRDLENLFQVQDDIAQSIAATVEPALSLVESREARTKPPRSMDAWYCYQRGVHCLFRFREPNLNDAMVQLKRAIKLDPSFAAAHARLAYVHVQSFWYGPHQQRQSHLEHAVRAARQAIDLDERDALGHLALGRAYVLQRRYDIGLAELREAVALNPALAQAHFALGQALHFAARSEESLPHLDAALRLSPHDPHVWTFLHMRALVLYRLGRIDEAEEAAKAAIRQTNATYWAYASLLSILGASGKTGEAAVILEELLNLKPEYSCRFAMDDFSHRDDATFKEQYIAGLRKAGLQA